jgi:hypothetical protein
MKARQIEFPLAVAVCAWCRPRELGAGLRALSHGICPRHLRKMKLELQRMNGAIPKRSSRRGQIEIRPGAEVMFLPL